MTTAALSAKGTTLKKATVAIAELMSISGPSISMEPIDVTNHDSVDSFREYIAGLRDGGEISIEGNFLDGNAGQAALIADVTAGTSGSYSVNFPDGAKWEFTAFVTAFENQASFDDKIGFSATLKINGKPIFTASV